MVRGIFLKDNVKSRDYTKYKVINYNSSKLRLLFKDFKKMKMQAMDCHRVFTKHVPKGAGGTVRIE